MVKTLIFRSQLDIVSNHSFFYNIFNTNIVSIHEIKNYTNLILEKENRTNL